MGTAMTATPQERLGEITEQINVLLAERSAIIFQLRAVDGYSLRQVAEWAGCTHQTIANMVDAR